MQSRHVRLLLTLSAWLGSVAGCVPSTPDEEVQLAREPESNPFRSAGEAWSALGMGTCQTVSIDTTALHGGEDTFSVSTVREFIRDVTYSGYHWRSGDGAQIKLYEQTNFTDNRFRRRFWLAIAGSAPKFFSGLLMDNNQNALTEGAALIAYSDYLRLVRISLRDAIEQGQIPSGSDLLFTGHSQGANVVTILAAILEDPDQFLTFGDISELRLLRNLLIAHDIKILGGVAVAGRILPALARQNWEQRAHGPVWLWVNERNDAVPHLTTAEWEQYWFLLNFSVDALSSLMGFVHLGLNGILDLPDGLSWLPDTTAIEHHSAIRFRDVRGRGAIDAHGQSYLDPGNRASNPAATNKLEALRQKPVCQHDYFQIKPWIGTKTLPVAINDWSPTRAPVSVGSTGIVDPEPDWNVAPSADGQGMTVSFDSLPTRKIVELTYRLAGQPDEIDCRVRLWLDDSWSEDPHLPAFNPTEPMAWEENIVHYRWRNDVFPEDAPFVAYAPGFSNFDPWDQHMPVANERPEVNLRLVRGWGFDCRTPPDYRPEEQHLALFGNQSTGTVDMCDYRSFSGRGGARFSIPTTDEDMESKNVHQPDGVPDMLWVDAAHWGHESAAQAKGALHPAARSLENAVYLWTEGGAREDRDGINQYRIDENVVTNRSLVTCGKPPVEPAPDGPPYDQGHPCNDPTADDPTCPTDDNRQLGDPEHPFLCFREGNCTIPGICPGGTYDPATGRCEIPSGGCLRKQIHLSWSSSQGPTGSCDGGGVLFCAPEGQPLVYCVDARQYSPPPTSGMDPPCGMGYSSIRSTGVRIDAWCDGWIDFYQPTSVVSQAGNTCTQTRNTGAVTFTTDPSVERFGCDGGVLGSWMNYLYPRTPPPHTTSGLE